MTTKSHGWAGTLTGKMVHYFGLTRQGEENYRPDGNPVALCHNALVMDGGERFKPEAPSDRKQCASCARYLANAILAGQLVKEPVAGELEPTPLAKGQVREVLRGKLKGLMVEVWEPNPDFPGFWMCWYKKGTGAKQTDTEVMLSAEQLGAVIA